MISDSKFDGVKGKVDLCEGGEGPAVGHWVVPHTLDQLGLTARPGQHLTDRLRSDELLPLVSSPGHQPQDVLGPEDHHHPAEEGPVLRGQEDGT